MFSSIVGGFTCFILLIVFLLLGQSFLLVSSFACPSFLVVFPFFLVYLPCSSYFFPFISNLNAHNFSHCNLRVCDDCSSPKVRRPEWQLAGKHGEKRTSWTLVTLILDPVLLVNHHEKSSLSVQSWSMFNPKAIGIEFLVPIHSVRSSQYIYIYIRKSFPPNIQQHPKIHGLVRKYTVYIFPSNGGCFSDDSQFRGFMLFQGSPLDHQWFMITI